MRQHLIITTTTLLAGGLLLAPLASAQQATASKTVQLSVNSAEHQSDNINGRMARPEVNADGAIVVFDSIANNLVRDDTNHSDDVFIRDRTTGKTIRASVSTSGEEGNNDSSRPDISADGRYVVYDSNATNLVDTPDQNGVLDVFRYDRAEQTTTLVSVSLAGDGSGNASSFGAAISGNGRFVAFTSDSTDLTRQAASGARDVFVRDMQTGKTRIVSLKQDGTAAGGASNGPAISANGRFVAFSSFASDIVPGDTNDDFDIFLRDRKLGQTTRVSVDSSGAEAVGGSSEEAAISNNGQRIAFASNATNLVANDTNGVKDVFVHDTSDDTTVRVSVGAGGVQSDGQSDGPGIRGGATFGPDISGDGRYVVFDSIATNLVADDTNTCSYGGGASFPGAGQCPDIFLRDLEAQTTARMSVSTTGQEANDASTDPAISEDGLAVVFFTTAAFVARDTNTCLPFFFGHPGQCPDIYLHTR
jgi:hypothetical protein